MFTITKNEIIKNGKCWYEDEYGNTAFVKKEDKVFTTKIRFKDKSVFLPPIKVSFPLDENLDGVNTKITYTEGNKNQNEDIKGGIENLTKLIQKWIQIMYDLSFFDMKNEIIKLNNQGISDEEINNEKLSRLVDYDEYKNFITEIF